MKINARLNDDGTGTVEIYPFTTLKGNVDLFNHVDVMKYQADSFTKDTWAKVSWSSIGSVEPVVAEDYAAAIKAGAGIAFAFDAADTMHTGKAGMEYSLRDFSRVTAEDRAAYAAERKAEEAERRAAWQTMEQEQAAMDQARMDDAAKVLLAAGFEQGTLDYRNTFSRKFDRGHVEVVLKKVYGHGACARVTKWFTVNLPGCKISAQRRRQQYLGLHQLAEFTQKLKA